MQKQGDVPELDLVDLTTRKLLDPGCVLAENANWLEALCLTMARPNGFHPRRQVLRYVVRAFVSDDPSQSERARRLLGEFGERAGRDKRQMIFDPLNCLIGEHEPADVRTAATAALHFFHQEPTAPQHEC